MDTRVEYAEARKLEKRYKKKLLRICDLLWGIETEQVIRLIDRLCDYMGIMRMRRPLKPEAWKEFVLTQNKRGDELAFFIRGAYFSIGDKGGRIGASSHCDIVTVLHEVAHHMSHIEGISQRDSSSKSHGKGFLFVEEFVFNAFLEMLS